MVEGAGGELYKVVQHPAGDGGVVHHQHVAAEDGEPAVDMPLAVGLLQGLIAQDCALAAGATNRQLHGQHGKAHNHQENEIQQHKQAAAVLSGHIGEPPDVANADGASGRNHQESQPGLK